MCTVKFLPSSPTIPLLAVLESDAVSNAKLIRTAAGFGSRKWLGLGCGFTFCADNNADRVENATEIAVRVLCYNVKFI